MAIAFIGFIGGDSMPGYKTHITGALLFCGLLSLFPFWLPLPITGKIVCAALAVFFGLWPDVDAKSKGQAIYLTIFLIVDSALIYVKEYEKAAYLGLLIVFPILARHRGWTHSLLGMIVVPGGIFLIALHYFGGRPADFFPYLFAAVLGYASHLILDRFF